MDGMLVVVDRLNIVLIIESVVQGVMVLVLNFMRHLVLIRWIVALMILIMAVGVLIRSRIVIRIVIVARVDVILVTVRMGIWAIVRVMDGMLVEVNRLDVMLIIEPVVQDVVVLMFEFMGHLMLISWIAAFMVL